MKKLFYYLIIVIIALLLILLSAAILTFFDIELGILWKIFLAGIIVNTCKAVSPKIKKMLKI